MGFLEAVRKVPEIEVVSDNQYGGATTETAASASESLLLAKNAAKGGIDGVFTPNESTTFGMLRALENTKLDGKLKFIGFDASDKLVDGVKRGVIDGLVLQNPFNMGYLAVKAVVSKLRGQPVEARTDTGSQLLEKANVDDPAMKELIRPDLARWLGP
jgi:ribose transport system substrate-binding protein